MIIQCEQCSTKFRLDDSRIKDNGVKVRCAKCRHVFTVKKEQPDAVQKSDFGVILDQTQGFGETSLPVDSFEPRQADNSPESQPEQQLESPAASPCVKPVNVADLDFSAFEGSQDDRQAAEAFKAEFSFGSPTAQPDRAHPPAEAPSLSNDAVDFDNVVFGDVSAEAPTESMAGAPHTEDDSPPPLEPPQAAEIHHEAAEPAPPEPLQPASPEPLQPAPSEPPVECAASQFEIQPAVAQPEPALPVAERIPAVAAQEELPPLSIPSRRKESSLLKILVFMLIVAILGALGYYGKDYFERMKPKAAQETGTIVLRSVISSFVKNSVTGSELLVISGEAVNSYNTPRAALQIKGMVYGDKGQLLVSKNVYCGNPLTAEQLADMPLDAIETAMANQLGSGLSNLEVAPGKAIPFTVVITTLPEGAKDFGVEPAGSQSITEKSK